MITMNHIKKLIENIIYFLICLSPFLIPYDNTIITIIYLISYLLYALLIALKKVKLNHLILLFFWFLLISLLSFPRNYIGNMVNVNRTTGFLINILLIYSISISKDNTKFIKVYCFFASFSLIFMILQVVLFYSINYKLVLIIPFLQMDERYLSAYNYLSNLTPASFYVRFHSCFSEPALYAEYLIPFLYLKLTGVKNIIKKDIMAALIISATIVISTSGIGIIMMFIAWIVYYYYYGKNSKMKLISIPLIAIGFIVVFTILMQNNSFNYTVSNLFSSNPNLSYTTSVESKASYRIYRGFAYYYELPIVNKIFGIGFGNASSFANIHNITTKFDLPNVTYEYFNGISQVLIYSGMIGFVIFIMFMYGIFKKTRLSDQGLLYMYLLLVLGSSFLFEGIGMIYLTLIFQLIRYKLSTDKLVITEASTCKIRDSRV